MLVKNLENKIKAILPFPRQALVFTCPHYKSFKIPWERENLLVTSSFFFSHNVFYPFEELSAIFIKFRIVVCKPFQFGRVKNLSFGKGSRILGEYGTCISHFSLTMSLLSLFERQIAKRLQTLLQLSRNYVRLDEFLQVISLKANSVLGFSPSLLRRARHIVVTISFWYMCLSASVRINE